MIELGLFAIAAFWVVCAVLAYMGMLMDANKDAEFRIAALREALGAGLLLAQMPGVDMAAWVVMARKVLENTK